MDQPRIVVLRQNIHGIDVGEYVDALRARLPDAEVRYAETPDRERELLPTAEVVTGVALDGEQLERAEQLQLFACIYAGTGHLDVATFEKHDVAVTSASGVHAPNISEHVVGSMIAFARGFRKAWDRKRHNEWRSYRTRELQGACATVVGLGPIGEAIVDRLEAFEMETVGVRYTPAKGGPTDTVYGFDEIHEAVPHSEYVILACPLTDTTRGLLDHQLFRTMRENALLVNIARGQIVDTDALLRALRWNGIDGAVLDVTDPEPLPNDHPLWNLSNVLITPHNAGHTPEYFGRRADILADNVDRKREDPDPALRNEVSSG